MIENLINNSFSEDKYLEFLKETFNLEIEKADIKKEENNQYIETYQELGAIEIDDIDEVGFFIIKTSTPNIEKTRIGFNKFIGTLIKKYPYDGLIVAIYHPNSDVWRLSYVALELDDRRKLSTQPKRYTFELGNVPKATAKIQLEKLNKNSSLEEIKDAFSVEKLSNDFFREYKKLYYELIESILVVVKKNRKEIQKDSNITIKDTSAISGYIKKMLGRIVFLYFVQKKGWLNKDKHFLTNLFEEHTTILKNKKVCEKTNFFDTVLEPLFINALNKKRNKNIFIINEKTYDIPYLNGGLFDNDRCDDLDFGVPNEDLKKVFELFDSYNFTIIEDTPHDSEVAIDPEMLGRVFEDLLEDRKNKGAFYTPREIVHYMCQESIKNYMDTKPDSIDELTHLKNIKILDPAIGSGAFPMGMLHELVEKRRELGDNTQPCNLKREVIQNSIYGIDIEPSAVEIAKLRFWLSIVVDEDKPEPLPNLFYKIMVGNSLIETIDGIDPLKGKTKKSLNELEGLFKKYYEEHKDKNGIKNQISIKLTKLFKTLLDSYSNQLLLSGTEKELKANQKETETAKQVTTILKELQTKHYSDKIFLYKLFFKDVLDSGGFDVVIGNPPYLRVQGIDKKSSEQYKKIFDSATGSYDLYVLFTEKALELLSKNGILNYIMPHKWINASFGKGLRAVSRDKVSKFISFGAYQVFNASTYTSLVWFQNNKTNKYLEYVELDRDLTTNQELEKYLTTLESDSYTKINDKDLTSKNWVFANKETYKVLEKLKEQPLFIKDIFQYTSQGVVTTGNDIFYLKGKINNDNFIGFSKALNKEITLEKSIVKPILLGKDVKRYSKLENKYFVIYPHYLIENKTKPFSEKYLKMNYPLTYEYLINFKDELIAKKIKYKNNSNDWFSLTRPREIEIYEQEKLITPQLALGGYFTYDTNNIYIDAGCYSFVKYKYINESYKYYIAILNSKVCWFFIKNTSAVFSGGYFYYKPIYLNHFKMPKIENIEDTKPFEILVDEIMSLKEQGKDTKDLEDKIDSMVYKLYGLNDDEVALIEGSI